jgi:mannose-6-phosphate isomerase-like protein (cupin superfamily)
MAKAGDVLENPVTGERVEFRKTAAETNGESLEYDLTYRPTGFVLQRHLHPHQSEKHEVLDGELGIVLDGEERVLRAGDAVVVPPATPHRLFPVGEGKIRMRFELRPALRTEELLETFVELARTGKVNRKGYPKLLYLAVLSREFEDEGYATRPPLGVQRAIFGPLAAIGRRLGYGRRTE